MTITFQKVISTYGGDGGIRTLDRALQPYNGLANRRLQPLGHVSRAEKAHRDICLTHPAIASFRRSSLARASRTRFCAAPGLTTGSNVEGWRPSSAVSRGHARHRRL